MPGRALLRRIVLVMTILVSAQISYNATPADAWPRNVCRAACGAAVSGCCYTFAARCPQCVKMYKPCVAWCIIQ